MKACWVLVVAPLLGCTTLDDTDPPAPGEMAAPDAGGTAPASALRVFTTHGAYAGDLTAYVDDAPNGLAAGDAICQIRADAAQLGGKWRAWLSSAGFDAIDRVTGDGPWNVVGTHALAFANPAQLQTESAAPLETDENGASLHVEYGYIYMWTGTGAGGIHRASTCGDWTATNLVGVYGDSAAGSFDWTDYAEDTCNSEKHLICLEQGPAR